MAKATKPKLKIMVSSTVYGIKPLLKQVYDMLEGFGYEVWMSAVGTLPNASGNHTYDDCLEAAEQCDLFLCLITGRYGSSVGGTGITQLELEAAINVGMPRWVMVEEKIKVARAVFRKLGYKSIEDREAFYKKLGLDEESARKEMLKREKDVFDDLRVIDMFEIATLQNIPEVQRKGNWVQSFYDFEDVKRYVGAQLGDYERSRKLVEAHKKKKAAGKKKVTKKKAGKAK